MVDNVINEDEARLNITWAGENGELPDAVSFDAADNDVKQWATEAVSNGYVPGIAADTTVSFEDYVVQRFAAKDGQPNKIFIRPKTPYGK